MILNVFFYSIHFTISKYLSTFYNIKTDFQLLSIALTFSPYTYFRIKNASQSPMIALQQDATMSVFLGFRVLLSMATDIFPIMAFQHIRENTGVTLMYLYPLWTIIFNNIYMRKCFELIDLGVAFGCLIGVCMIMKPFGESNENDTIFGFLMATATGICFGLLPIFNKITMTVFSPDVMLFFVGLSNLCLFPVVYMISEHEEVFTLASITLLAFFGICGFLGLYMFILATSVQHIYGKRSRSDSILHYINYHLTCTYQLPITIHQNIMCRTC